MAFGVFQIGKADGLMINRAKWIFVDVDGTLTEGVAERIRERVLNIDDDCKFVLWSSRGQDYAKMVAERMGITDMFDNIISKPDYILDDKGWQWIKYTRVIIADEI